MTSVWQAPPEGRRYTVTGLTKGMPSLDEIRALLLAWRPQEAPSDFASRVQREGILTKQTARRVQDLVLQIFQPWFLKPEDRGAQWLKALVEAGGKPINTLRQHLETPLGFLRQVDEEIERRIHLLIQRGEIAEEHGRKIRDQLIQNSPKIGSAYNPDDEDITRIIQSHGVPTKEDIQQLFEQIETLSEKIKSLEK